MTQTRYRLINGEDYEYLEEGKAYPPDYKAADTGPKIIDLVTTFPNDWKKVRHRPNRKRVTAAMYNQVVAERDEQKEIAENIHKHNLKLFDDLVVAKTMCQAIAIELDKKSKEADELRDERDAAHKHVEQLQMEIAEVKITAAGNLQDRVQDVARDRDMWERSFLTTRNQIKAAEKKIDSQQKEIDLYIVLLVITLLTSAVGWYLALL